MGDPTKDKFYYGAADYLRKKNPNISQEEVSTKVEEFRQNPEQYYADSYKELTGKTIDKKALETASQYDGITIDPNRLSPNQINFVDNDKLELISTKKELDKKNSEMMLPLNASDEEIGKYWDKNSGVAKSFIGSITEKVSSVFESLIGDGGPEGIKTIALNNKDNKSRNNYITEEKKKREEIIELEKSYESKLLEKDLDKVSISDFFNDAKKVTRKSTTPEIMTALLNPTFGVNDVFSGNDAREERQNAFLDSQKYLEVLNKKAEITFNNISDPLEKEIAQKIVKGEKPEIAEGFKPSKNFENFIKSYDNLNQQYTESAEMFGKDELGKKKTYDDILHEHRLKRQISADKNQNWFTKGKDEQTLPSGDKEIRYIPSRSRTWLNGLMSDYIGFAKNAMDSFSNNEIEEKIKEAKKNGNEKEYLRLQRMLSMDDLKEDLRKIDITTQSSDVTNAVYENRVFVDGFKIQVDSKGNVQRMVNSDGKTVHTLSTAQQNAIQKYQADPKKYEVESGFSDSWGKSLLNATGNTVTQMLPMIAGGIMTAPLRGVGMFGTAVANTVPTLAMFMPSYSRYFEERFRETGDWNNASSYAGLMAGVESAIEWRGGGAERRFAENVSSAITPELLRSAGQRAANTMLNARNLATSTGGDSFMNSLIKELKKDVLSEEAEEFATLFIHSGINKLYGRESTVDANELLTTLLITPLATAPMSIVGNIANYKGKKTDFKNMVLAAASDVQKTEDVLVEMVSKNITTQDDAKKKMDLVKAVASRKDNYGERAAGMNLSYTEKENALLEDYMFEEAVGEINGKKVDYTKEVDAIIAAATKRAKIEAATEKNDPIIPIKTEDEGAERMKRPLRYNRRSKNNKGYAVEDTIGPDGEYSTVSNDDNIREGEISLNFNITNDDAEILSSEIQNIAAAEGISLKMDVAKSDNNTDVPLRVSFNSSEDAQIIHEKLKSSAYYNQMVPQKTDRILGKKIDDKVQFGVRNLKDIRKAQDIIENSTKDEDGNYLYSNEGLEMIISPEEYAQYEDIIFAADNMWQPTLTPTPKQEIAQPVQPLNELRALINERDPQQAEPQIRTFDQKGFERLNVKSDANLQDAFDYTDGDKKEIPVFRNGQKGVLRVDEGGAMEFDNGKQIIEYGNINDQRTTTLSELGFTFPEDFKVKNGNIVIDGEMYQNPFSSPDGAIIRDQDGNITSVELEKREIRGGYNGIQVNDVITPVTFTGQRAIDVATILMENELATNTKLREEFESFPAPDIQPSFVPKNVTVDQLAEILLEYFPDKPALAMETAKIYFAQAVRMSTIFPQQYPTPASYIIDKINKDTVQNITDIERLKTFLTNIINTTDNQERIDFAQRALDNINRINAIKVQTPQELITEINSKPLNHISLGPGLGMGQNEANGTYLSTETKGNRYELIKTPGAKIYSAKVNISNPYDLDANMDDINSLRNRNLPVAIQRYISDNNIKGNDKKQLESVTSFDSNTLETFPGFDQYLADAVTSDLQSKGYDSLYSRQSDTREGYLVVFNKDNVTLTEQKFVEKVIKKKKADGRGKNTFSTISKLMDKIGGPGNNPMLHAIEAIITGNISRDSFLKEVTPSMKEAMKLVFSKVLTTKQNGITISEAAENRGEVDEIAVKDAIIALLNNYDYNVMLDYVSSIANMDEMRDPREIAFENDPEFRAMIEKEQAIEAELEREIMEMILQDLYAELEYIDSMDMSFEEIEAINNFMANIPGEEMADVINSLLPFDPEFEFISEQIENKIEDGKQEDIQGEDGDVVAGEAGSDQRQIDDDRQEVEDQGRVNWTQLENEVWDNILSKGSGLMVPNKKSLSDYNNLIEQELVYVNSFGSGNDVSLRLTEKGQQFIENSKQVEKVSKEEQEMFYDGTQLPRTVRELSDLEAQEQSGLMSGLFLSNLEKGEEFTIDNKKFVVVRKTKSSKKEYKTDKYTGSYSKTSVTIESESGARISFDLWDNWIQNGQKMTPVLVSGKGSNNLSRDIEGTLTVDLLNENNPFHEKSYVFNKIQSTLDELNRNNEPKVVDEIDRVQKLENATNQLKKEKSKLSKLEERVTEMRKNINKIANQNLFSNEEMGIKNPELALAYNVNDQVERLAQLEKELGQQRDAVNQLQKQVESLRDLKNQAELDFVTDEKLILKILPSEQADNADIKLQIMQRKNYFTLWAATRKIDPNGEVRYSYTYLTTLSQNIDEAQEKALLYMNKVARGGDLSEAFVGKNTFKLTGAEQTIAVSKAIGNPDDIKGINKEAGISNAIGFGKYANTTIDDLLNQDINYALWLVNNASGKRGQEVAYIIKEDYRYREIQDKIELESERVKAFEEREDRRKKGENVPVATLIRGEDGVIKTIEEVQVQKPSKPKQERRIVKDQITDIIPPIVGIGNNVDPELKQKMYPSQIEGAEMAINSMMKNGVFLNGDGAGVGKTRQIVAVAKHFADKGNTVIIISENAAIGKPWESKGDPVLGGSMQKDSQDMGVNLNLLEGPVQEGQIYVSTYNRIKDGDVPKGAIIIFDESQNLANTFGRNPDEGNADEQKQWEAKFRSILGKADATSFYSATPADKPHQLAYLYKVLGFNSPDEFLNSMLANGGVIKKRKFGRTITKYYDVPNSKVAKRNLYNWVNGLMVKAGNQGKFVKREISYEGTDVQFHDVDMEKRSDSGIKGYRDAIEDMSDAEKSGYKLLAPNSYILYAAELAKIGSTIEMVQRELKAGRKVIIFASRVNEMEIRGKKMMMDGEWGEPEVVGTIASPIRILTNELNSLGITFVELHGKSKQSSQKAQKDFSENSNVLIASLESGGTGINLDDNSGTQPRTEIFMFAPYRGISTIQGMGRIWRASTVQNDNNPNRFVFVTVSSVAPDASRSSVLAKKLQLMDAAIGGSAVSRLPMSKVDYDKSQLVGLEIPEEGVESPIMIDRTGTLFPVEIDWAKSKGDGFWAKANADILEWYERGGVDRTGLNISVFKGRDGDWVVTSDKAYTKEEFAPEGINDGLLGEKKVGGLTPPNNQYEEVDPIVEKDKEISLGLAFKKVANGTMNADDAAIFLDTNDVEVTNEIYDKLREEERKFIKKEKGIQVGDIVTVKGKNGNPDVQGNYRGKTNDGKNVVVVNGIQGVYENTDIDVQVPTQTPQTPDLSEFNKTAEINELKEEIDTLRAKIKKAWYPELGLDASRMSKLRDRLIELEPKVDDLKKQVSKKEEKVKKAEDLKKEIKKEPISDIDRELNDAGKEFMDIFRELKNLKGNLGIYSDPQKEADLQAKLLSKGIQLVDIYIRKGVTEFGEMVRQAALQFGEMTDEFVDAMKMAYTSAMIKGRDLSTKFDEVKSYNLDKLLNKIEDGQGRVNANIGRSPKRSTTNKVQAPNQGELPFGIPEQENGSMPRIDQNVPGEIGDEQDRRTGDSDRGDVGNDITPTISVDYFEIQEDTRPFNPSTRFNENIAAIELLATLYEEGRPATKEEKDILSKYVGFGGLKVILNEPNEVWNETDEKLRPQYVQLMQSIRRLETQTGYSGLIKGIKESVLSAFYTPIPIIKSMYDILEKMGFNGGTILDPSSGIGNFIGAMPTSMRSKSKITSIEKEPITAMINRLLYPETATIINGYEDSGIRNNSHDLVVSNIPFGDFNVYDKTLSSNQKKLPNFIHNYFFVKAVNTAREGGIIAFITSTGVMDSPSNQKIRDFLSKNTNFLGGFRLPNTTFKNNANTSVTSDIIFLQKNTTNPTSNYNFINNVDVFVGANDKSVSVNEYFAQNPDAIIGQLTSSPWQFQEERMVVIAPKEMDIAQELIKRAETLLPKGIYQKGSRQKTEVTTDGTVPPNTIYVKDGIVQFNNSLGEAKTLPKSISTKQAEDFIALRNVLSDLYFESLNNPNSQKTAQLRKDLNTTYDAFVKSHGKINANKNLPLVRDDAKGVYMKTLEINGKKADIFTKNTINSNSVPEITNFNDALVYSLQQNGNVDINFIADLLDRNPDDIIQENYATYIFDDGDGNIITRDEYLSGNVKAKLNKAKSIARTNPLFERNVEELLGVIPEDINPIDIEVNIGARWIDTKYYVEFLNEILNNRQTNVIYSKGTDEYVVDGPYTVESTTKYGVVNKDGVPKINAYKIFLKTLEGRTPVVTYKNADGQQVIDKDATDNAIEKQNLIKEAFDAWIWRDAERREELSKIYNERYNTTVKRKYNGDHLVMPGLTDYVLRPHQKDAIWMIMQNNGGIVDHMVGAGKSLVLIGASMEMKRTGVAKKPVIIGLKSTIPALVANAREAYPMAKILAPKESDFTPANRKALFANIANNDYDIIIMSHEQFGKIPQNPDLLIELMQEELDQIEKEITNASGSTNLAKAARTGLEKRKKNIEAKIRSLSDMDKDSDMLTFDKMGIDHLLVDESQQFKNLEYTTKVQGIAGLGDPKGSKRSFNMLTAIRQLQQNNGADKGTTFLSGTPISNSMVEMYLLLKYLRPNKLKELGFDTFDAWAKQFARESNEIEFTVAGTLSNKTRFRSFINVPELSMLYNEIADVRSDNNLILDKPEAVEELIVIKQNQDQKDFTSMLVEFANTGVAPAGLGLGPTTDAMKKSKMLLITGLSSKAAIDLRLVFSDALDNPTGKLQIAANEITEIYNNTKEDKGTQLVFSDIGTPKSGILVEDLRDLLEDVYRINSDDLDSIFQNQNDPEKTNTITQIKKKLGEVLEYDNLTIEDLIKEAKESSNVPFTVYAEIRKKLIENGVDPNEIAFIHDYKTDKRKSELFRKVNAGEIRIVLGSTQKLGTGVNAQQKIVAMHHIDVPWRPADMEQRNGRGIRQGNYLAKEKYDNKVKIFKYGTEQTLDAMKYDGLNRKAYFINQLKDGSVTDRFIEEDDNNEGARIVAALSGNPLIYEKAVLEKKLDKLNRAKRNHKVEVSNAENGIVSNKKIIDSSDRQLDEIRKDSIVINQGYRIENKDVANGEIDKQIDILNSTLETTTDTKLISDLRVKLNELYLIKSDSKMPTIIVGGVELEKDEKGKYKNIGEKIKSAKNQILNKPVGHQQEIATINNLPLYAKLVRELDGTFSTYLFVKGNGIYPVTDSNDAGAQAAAITRFLTDFEKKTNKLKSDVILAKERLASYEKFLAEKGEWEGNQELLETQIELQKVRDQLDSDKNKNEISEQVDTTIREALDEMIRNGQVIVVNGITGEPCS